MVLVELLKLSGVVIGLIIISVLYPPSESFPPFLPPLPAARRLLGDRKVVIDTYIYLHETL